MPNEGVISDHKVAHDGARRLCYPSLAWPHGTITRCGGKKYKGVIKITKGSPSKYIKTPSNYVNWGRVDLE